MTFKIMLKQIFHCCQKTIYHPYMLTLLYISYVCSETHQNALAKKGVANFFPALKFC